MRTKAGKYSKRGELIVVSIARVHSESHLSMVRADIGPIARQEN